MLSVRILIPDAARLILFDISLNTACTLLLASIFFIKYVTEQKHESMNLLNTLNRFILFFLISSLIITFIPDYTPWKIQISTLIQFFITQLLPIFLLTCIIRTPKDIIKFIKVFSYSFSICIIYAIGCFIMKIPYPYNQIFIDYFGYARDANMILEIESVQGGVAGRIIGTPSADSYSFGMIVPIAFTIQYCLYYYLKGKWNLVLTILLGIGVLLTSRRSPIISVLIFLFILFLEYDMRKKTKYLRWAMVIISGVFIAILIFPEMAFLKNIIETVFFFWDDKVAASNGVSGSSVSLREYQFFYTINQIKKDWLFGNGWGATYYGYHPNMHGWEGIVFSTLMQLGVWGIILWSALFCTAYKYSAMFFNKKINCKAFMLSAVTLCLFTDTIYLFFILLGAVILNKLHLLHPKTNNIYENSIRL